jgi:hypothetical protein
MFSWKDNGYAPMRLDYYNIESHIIVHSNEMKMQGYWVAQGHKQRSSVDISLWEVGGRGQTIFTIFAMKCTFFQRKQLQYKFVPCYHVWREGTENWELPVAWCFSVSVARIIFAPMFFLISGFSVACCLSVYDTKSHRETNYTVGKLGTLWYLRDLWYWRIIPVAGRISNAVWWWTMVKQTHGICHYDRVNIAPLLQTSQNTQSLSNYGNAWTQLNTNLFYVELPIFRYEPEMWVLSMALDSRRSIFVVEWIREEML